MRYIILLLFFLAGCAPVKTYEQFQETELLSLENYLQEYFEKMLKKLRDLNYDQSQAAKRKDLTF